MKADQEVRTTFQAEYQKALEKAGGDPGKVTFKVPEKFAQVDERNTARMKEVVAKYGWPGQSLVGKDGANAAWLLVQHADHDREFQRQCLKLLGDAVKGGEATGQQLAYLTDRVRVADKQPQLYGTQFTTVGGKFQPQPIEDEKNVDQRRKEIGLPPMAEYRRLMEKMYAAPAKK